MKDELDSLFSALKQEPLPALDAGFDDAVLREILSRKQPIAWWNAWENPRVMATAAAAAIVIGLTTAFFTPPPQIKDSDALGLDVFSATPRHLPLTQLASR
jgi:uncharacterized membrane protein YeiH